MVRKPLKTYQPSTFEAIHAPTLKARQPPLRLAPGDRGDFGFGQNARGPRDGGTGGSDVHRHGALGQHQAMVNHQCLI